jgi:hypothetical protein
MLQRNPKMSAIEGLPDLLESLRALPEAIQKRVLKAWALRRAREAAAAAQAAAPKGKTGNLRRGIRAAASSASTLRKRGSIARAVAFGAKPANHFHLVNLGVAKARQTKRGFSRGTMPANPFFGRATQAVAARAQADAAGDLSREVQRLLDAAVKRTLKRGST